MKHNTILNLLYAPFVFLAVMLFSFVSNAASASKTINLWQGYNTVEFTVTFEDEYETHTVKVTSPDGQVAEKDSTGFDSCIVKMNDCPAGDYKVEISADGTDAIKANVETSCYGPVVVTDGTSLYEISSKISGLRYYFVDGDLYVIWDEEIVNSLNLKVTNPENMQVIEDTTVKGGNFSVDIPDYVDEIEVYAVASSEAKIDGAGERRTIRPVRSINANVTFPEEEITNRNDLNFDLSCASPVTIYVYDNGSQIYTNSYESGDYTVNVMLSGVNNTISVYVEDENLNAVTYSYYVVKDVVAPTLTLSERLDGTETTAETIDVIGYVTGGADKLLLNSIEIEFDSVTGRFAETVPLTIGTNSVSICAVDDAGNESTIISVITRTEPKTTSKYIKYLKYAGILLVIAVIVFAIVKKSKSLKNNTPVPAPEPEPEQPKKKKKKKVK